MLPQVRKLPQKDEYCIQYVELARSTRAPVTRIAMTADEETAAQQQQQDTLLELKGSVVTGFKGTWTPCKNAVYDIEDVHALIIAR